MNDQTMTGASVEQRLIKKIRARFRAEGIDDSLLKKGESFDSIIYYKLGELELVIDVDQVSPNLWVLCDTPWGLRYLQYRVHPFKSIDEQIDIFIDDFVAHYKGINKGGWIIDDPLVVDPSMEQKFLKRLRERFKAEGIDSSLLKRGKIFDDIIYYKIGELELGIDTDQTYPYFLIGYDAPSGRRCFCYSMTLSKGIDEYIDMFIDDFIMYYKNPSELSNFINKRNCYVSEPEGVDLSIENKFLKRLIGRLKEEGIDDSLLKKDGVLEYEKYYKLGEIGLGISLHSGAVDLIVSWDTPLGVKQLDYESSRFDVLDMDEHMDIFIDDLIMYYKNPDKRYNFIVKFIGKVLDRLKGKSSKV